MLFMYISAENIPKQVMKDKKVGFEILRVDNEFPAKTFNSLGRIQNLITMKEKIVRWQVVDGWCVREPEIYHKNMLKIYCPYKIGGCIIMPLEDALVPTGLWFSGFLSDYMIIPLHHTYPNVKSDIYGVGSGFPDEPILHMSVCRSSDQVFLHIINLGNKELIIKPGKLISYFLFTPLLKL